MTTSHRIETVIDQLSATLNNSQIPLQHQKMGRQLLSNLRKPVRIVITGAAGSGKSTLLNMILAQKVLGPANKTPVIEVAHGDYETVSIEGRDGSKSDHEGLLRDLPMPDDAVHARQELPSSHVVGQSYFEIALGVGQHATSVVNWVSEWADIVLWCTETFTEDERLLWQSVPDALKDRSCLVLTKADQLLSQGALEDKTSELSTIVADEFLGLFPIALRQALKARTEGACLSASRWESSGGQRLVDRLTTLIAQGRSEDLDQAEMLIDMYAGLPSEPVLTENLTDVHSTTEEALPSEIPVVSVSENTLANNGPVREYDTALSILENGADQLLDLATGSALDNEQVISVCTDTLAQLNSHFATNPQTSSHFGDSFQDVQDGQEMVLLCELEGCEDAAADAVTVLLQLKKEFREKSTQTA